MTTPEQLYPTISCEPSIDVNYSIIRIQWRIPISNKDIKEFIVEIYKDKISYRLLNIERIKEKKFYEEILNVIADSSTYRMTVKACNLKKICGPSVSHKIKGNRKFIVSKNNKCSTKCKF